MDPQPGSAMKSWTSEEYNNQVALKLDTFSKSVTNKSLDFYPFTQGEQFWKTKMHPSISDNMIA